MFIYTHAVYPRTTAERLFKYIYNFGFILNFAAFIITFADFHQRVENTFTNYWGASSYELRPGLTLVLKQCEYTDDVTINNIKSTSTISISTVPFFFTFVTIICFGVFLVHGFMLVTDLHGKVNFAFNIRNWRMRGFYLRINLFILAFYVLYTIAVICLIAASKSTRDFLTRYIVACTETYINANPELVAFTEQDVDTVFGTPLETILWAVVINLFFYCFGWIHLMGYAMKEENARIAELKHPWEKGCLCLPHNPLLEQFCRERKELAKELLARPRVRPWIHPDSSIPTLGDEYPEGAYGDELFGNEEEGYGQEGEMNYFYGHVEDDDHRTRSRGSGDDGDENGTRRSYHHNRRHRHHRSSSGGRGNTKNGSRDRRERKSNKRGEDDGEDGLEGYERTGAFQSDSSPLGDEEEQRRRTGGGDDKDDDDGAEGENGSFGKSSSRAGGGSAKDRRADRTTRGRDRRQRSDGEEGRGGPKSHRSKQQQRENRELDNARDVSDVV